MTPDDIRKEIEAAFRIPDSMLGKERPMTATEIRTRMKAFNEHAKAVMQPTVDRIQSEILAPVFYRIYLILARREVITVLQRILEKKQIATGGSPTDINP